MKEPQEICDEDNLASVNWKETPAGDAAAVRCPRNATVRNMTREHLSKAQRGLVGEGVSDVLQNLVEISQDGTSYSGDLLSTFDVLRNMTEIFRRAYYNPTSSDVQNFVQVISNILTEDNRDKWEEAQLVQLFRLLEDFIDVVGFRMKEFQDSYQATDNLVVSIQKLPVKAAKGLTFPVKGWRGMVDWARNAEDKVTISKSIFSTGISDTDDSSVFVVGTVIYRNLAGILGLQR
ncbi:hypothetical protein Chor_002577 [Crotalus horridus]